MERTTGAKPLSNAQRILQLKTEIGQWMYTMMANFTKDEFVHIVRTMAYTPSLKQIYDRIKHVRKLYTEMLTVCTPKQTEHAAKPFFCGVTYQEKVSWLTEDYMADQQDTTNNEEEEDSAAEKCVLVFSLSATAEKIANVTKHIPNRAAFGSYSNAISSALCTQNAALKRVAAQIDQDAKMIELIRRDNKAALESVVKKAQEQREAATAQRSKDNEVDKDAVTARQKELDEEVELILQTTKRPTFVKEEDLLDLEEECSDEESDAHLQLRKRSNRERSREPESKKHEHSSGQKNGKHQPLPKLVRR